MKKAGMRDTEITEMIIGCAYTVHNKMGYGFLESVYEKCMLIELKMAGIKARAQESIDVHYGDEKVGEFFADLLVEDSVIVELKSVRSIIPAHEVQLVNYLTATRMDIGLLLNFGERRVGVKRKTRLLPDNPDF